MRCIPGLLALLLAACSSSGTPESTPQNALPAHCGASDVASLTLPWYYDRPGSPTFKYSFQVRAAAAANAPIVVALPGGPGEPSMGAPPESAIGAIPPNYTVVYTDQRGSGCNASISGEFPLDFFSTEYMAKDVLALVKALNLQNYSIYGRSYGTVHATALTRLIEAEAITPPKALVLESTLGKAFANFDAYIAGTQAQWTRTKPSIAPTVLSQVVNGPMYLGYSSSQWAHFIAAALLFGKIPGQSDDYIALVLNPLVNPGSPAGQAAKSIVDAIITGRPSPPPAPVALGCVELWGTFKDFDFVGGDLATRGPDSCAANGLAMSKPFDSASQLVHVPITYFHGANDSASPVAGAQYHYANQTKAQRSFVTVGGASHHPLDVSLRVLGCAPAVWDSVIANPAGLGTALSSCAWPITLDQAPPVP